VLDSVVSISVHFPFSSASYVAVVLHLLQVKLRNFECHLELCMLFKIWLIFFLTSNSFQRLQTLSVLLHHLKLKMILDREVHD